MRNVRIGIIGSGAITWTHLEALKRVPGVDVVAVASRHLANAESMAGCWGIPHAFDDYRRILEMKSVDAVTVAFPNSLHAKIAIEAVQAGKHVICEKPLCMTISEAKRMIRASKKSNVRIFYAEELPFIPKFIRLKELIDEGALGEIYMIRATSKHAGPYSDWFWKRESAGGGVLIDLGCHAIELCRFLGGKKRVRAVTSHMATYLHREITDLEDHVLLTMEYDDGTIGLVECSWALKGGMDCSAEVFGTEGVCVADPYRDTGLRAYSSEGYGMRPDLTGGWSSPEVDAVYEKGYVGEMAHFVECIRDGKEPSESVEDGLAVLEIMLAAYESAGTGRRIELPFMPKGYKRPIDLFFRSRKE